MGGGGGGAAGRGSRRSAGSSSIGRVLDGVGGKDLRRMIEDVAQAGWPGGVVA